MHTFQDIITQAVLVTDGESSFAIFLYDNPAIIQEIVDARVGFDAGEGRRRTDVLDSLGTVNVFRIDGKGYYHSGEPSDVITITYINCLQGSSIIDC